MKVNIHPSWQEVLSEEFEKDYFQKLVTFVKHEYATERIYPKGSRIFSAFNLCGFDKIKAVIIGQDPYHGKGQANGLSFSVNTGIPCPPSLQNIFQEIKADVGKHIPANGNLERWAEQGVLLLNAILTVRAATPCSHQHKGWEIFTDAVIKKISDKKKQVVFLLWGAYAQQKAEHIDPQKHLILRSPHPSPFSANRGFFGNRHFSKTNAYLRQHNLEEIYW